MTGDGSAAVQAPASDPSGARAIVSWWSGPPGGVRRFSLLATGAYFALGSHLRHSALGTFAPVSGTSLRTPPLRKRAAA
jgi:hypothetical protein